MWKSKPHNRARFLRGPLVSMSLVFPFSAALGTGDPPCPFEPVTERISVIVGSDHRRCPRQSVNYPLTNPAAIIGETGVILIDPGSSLQARHLVLERVQAITDKPVVGGLQLAHPWPVLAWEPGHQGGVSRGADLRP